MAPRRKAVLPMLLAAACGGGGDGGGGGPGTGPATVAEYCDQYWTGLSARWAECQRGSAAYQAAIHDPALRCGDTVQAVAAGRATYQSDRAGACLTWAETASCDALEALLDDELPQADCLAAVAGHGAPSDACYSSVSCASDLCLGSPATCPSVCATPIAQGQACSSVPCARGLHCDSLAGFTCQPLEVQGATCLVDEDCQPGLRCDFSNFTQTCQPRRTSGDCVADSACAIGYACVGAPTGTCVQRLAAGDACTQGENACGPGLWCGPGASSTCIDGPTATQACSIVNGERRPCIGGTCESGTCVAWLGEGATCGLPAQCEPTAVCDANACTTLCAEP